MKCWLLSLTLSNPMECSPVGSSVHAIFQARILEWVAIPFFRGPSWPRDHTWVSCTASRFFTIWATREAQSMGIAIIKKKKKSIITIESFGKDVEKLEPLFIAGRNVKWCSHCGKQCSGSSKIELPYDPTIPLGYIHKRTESRDSKDTCTQMS